MRFFFSKRQFSSLISANPNSPKSLSIKESKIFDFCKSGALLDAIHLLNSTDVATEISVKPILYAKLLQTSTKVRSFTHGLQIHAHVVKSGLENDRFVGNCLLAVYFKLAPDFRETRRVFEGLFFKDAISWTSMISGYIRVGKYRSSLDMFWEMLDSGTEPNGFTLSAVIKACSEIGELRLGRSFHGVVLRRGLGSSNVISSALIDFYGSNYRAFDARQVFDEMHQPDAICWTTVISALTKNDFYNESLGYFYSMQRSHDLNLDEFTFGTVLTACSNLKRLKQGKQVHAKVIVSGLRDNVVVGSSLVDMYGKCSLLNLSQNVFDRMPKKNSVSWSALLGAYCQNNDHESVIRTFREMDCVDLYCFGTVLRACAGLAAVRLGKEVHCQYVRRDSRGDVIIESALVDLYAKSGYIDFARSIFTHMPVKNLITWNAMINGFAQNGRGEEAVSIFEEMINSGMNPDGISFIGVLYACGCTGLVDKGRRYFALMVEEYGIKPQKEHYNCVVDLLGRAGLLEEAESLIENADCRDDSSLWTILLGACTASTNSSTAERIARKTIKLAPDYHLSYVLLANVYKAVGRWNDALKIRKLMMNRGVKKMPGKSWMFLAQPMP